MPTVLHARAFEDNYIWLVCDEPRRNAAIVDPGDAQAVFAALAQYALTPIAILCTHHHADHTAGVEEIVDRYALPVYGPATERIARITQPLTGGQRIGLAELSLELEILDVPGHTAGHIAYYGGGLLLCGDTLFSAGCGRLFEGSAAQLHASLGRLAGLPDDTDVYCAHEYTQANLRFARTVEPDNPRLAARQRQVQALRAAGRPSLPSTLGVEKTTNPFLRAHVPAVRRAAEQHAGRALNSADQVFAELRRWKDHFRG